MRKPNRLVVALVALNACSIAALLASISGVGVLPVASAQPDQPKPSPFNSGEKLNQMVVQLESMNRKLTDLEKKLTSGISVKVTEMPEVIVRDPAKKK